MQFLLSFTPKCLPPFSRSHFTTSLLTGFTVLLLLFFLPQDLAAQQARLRGFVTDASNGEPLLGVNVVLSNETGTLLGAATNQDGVYDVSRIDPGRYGLRVSFIGFRTHTDSLRFRAGETVLLNIALQTDEAELEEVLIETERESGAARLTAGLQPITARDIEVVPSPDVSGDLVSYLTAQPGVVTLGDRGGQLFVRGGEPSHNMALLDGMYVHQPYHILGFYSAFPSEIINRADFYAAGHGSRYSGRISAVLDVYSRNGNKRNFAGTVSLGPFISGLSLEGPLVKDRLSFLASVRQSVIEYGARTYTKEDLPYKFGDAFAKLHFVISDNHRISVSGLYTHDKGELGEASEDNLDEIRWTNAGIGLRYIFVPKNVPFIGEILMSVSRLRSEVGIPDSPVRLTEFQGFNYQVNMTNFMGRAEWKWGLFWRAPETNTTLGGAFQNVNFGFARRHKAGVYIEPEFYINEELHVRVGVTGQLFPGQDRASIVEPRLRLIWRRGVHEINAAAGLYHQEVFGLSDRRDATNVFTAWRSAPRDDLSRASHVLLGYRVAPLPWLEVSAEGYYKNLTNLFISEWTSFPRFTTRLQRADGTVMGVDLRMEFRHERFYGFINYGLSSVEYEAKQASLELWYGSETLQFRPPHDRRHLLNLVGTYTLSGFDFSVRWNYASGRPFNRIFGFDGFVLMHGVQDLFSVPDDQRVIYERPFKGVLPSYHRLDVTVAKRFDFGRSALTAQVGAINVYDRKNIFALDTFTLRTTYQLPFIPTIGLKFEFR